MQDTEKEQPFQEYRKNRYDAQIAWYDDKANKYKRKFVILQWLQIILTCLIPVAIAIDFGLKHECWKWITLGISVFSAIVTSCLRVFKIEELWKSYRSTCELLRKEIHYYDFRVPPYSECDTDVIDRMFVDRVEGLISSENISWRANTNTCDKDSNS